MKRYALPLSIAAVFSVMTVAYAAKDYVILEVGSKEIKKSEVEAIWQTLFPAGAAPDFDSVEEPIKQNVLRGVVSEYLLHDEAVAAGVEKLDDVKTKIDEAARKIVVRKFIDMKTEALVTEKDIKAEYEKAVKDGKDKEEVRARHILVADEAKAKELKKKIDGGADFEKLATENSNDPGSKKQGGDLGFFPEGSMVKEFSDAAFKLKVGQVSDPVKTKFGWHIIKAEERRKLKMPSYADAKDKIKNHLTEEKLNEYVNKLVDQTQVKYFEASGKEKDFTKTPDITKGDKAEKPAKPAKTSAKSDKADKAEAEKSGDKSEKSEKEKID